MHHHHSHQHNLDQSVDLNWCQWPHITYTTTSGTLKRNNASYRNVCKKQNLRTEEYQKPSILYICGGSTENNSYFQQLVKWRKKQGYVVYTASTSETGGSNTTAVKNYIQGSMNWDVPPEFVTLVGDDGETIILIHILNMIQVIMVKEIIHILC